MVDRKENYKFDLGVRANTYIKKKVDQKYPRSATWRQSVMKWNSAVCWNPSLLNLIVFDIVLPAILGVHGMLTQTQSHFAEKMEAGKALRGSGLKKYKPGELNTTVLLYVLRVVLLQSMGAIYNLYFCLWETYKTLFSWKGFLTPLNFHEQPRQISYL